MVTQANIAFFKNEFIATLTDGQRIQQSNLHELADALYRAGVHAKGGQYEWHAGQRMRTPGKKEALRAAIRRKEHQPPAGLSIAT